MSRQLRFPNLLAAVKRSFASHKGFKSKQTNSTRARRLGLECLEERKVLAASFLGQIGGPGEQYLANKQEMDSAGNMYVNGRFEQNADFDTGNGVATLTSAGNTDGFVAKYAVDGKFAWARRFGGSDMDAVWSVAVDPTGSYLYATGQFSTTADFTGDGLPDATAVGQSDVFLIKLDAISGQTVWFRTLGSAYQDVANDVVTDGAFVYVTGAFRGAADFDPGSNSITLTPAGSGNNRPADAFVWKLDADGIYAAAWQLGGTYDNYGLVNDAGNSLALDGSSLYLQGSFGGTVDFDPSAVVQSKTSVGGVDAFIARYTTSGQLTWVQSIGSVNYDDTGFRMTADSGSLYLTGSFAGTIDFDPGSGIATLDSGNAYSDVVMAKYNKADGALSWARQFGGAGNEYGGEKCVTDSMTGAVYFGMNSLSPTIDLNPSIPGGEFTNMSDTTNYSDGFLVKLDANGNYLNAWQVGGLGYEGSPRPMGLIDGTLYVAGTFEQTVIFPTGGTLTSIGGRDMYLMAFDPQLHAAIVTPTSGLITTEAGGQATFTVRLDSQPTADVIIPVSSSNTTEGTVPTSSLTFTTANWNVPQTVTITGVDDFFIDGNIAYMIVLGAAISTDPLYNGVNPADVSVTNIDNETLQTKFYVVNDGSPDRTYEYSANGTAVENYAINTGNTAPRGAASTAAGDKVWVVDANHKVYVYNTIGTLLGSWTASNFSTTAQLEGIATNGTDVWIVDGKTDMVYRYVNAAGLISGSQNAVSSFSLNSSNTSPKDIVTDGNYLWVVNDSSTDKVFKYTIGGTYVGSWTISTPGASSPTGFTLDPSQLADIWIVDSGTDKVYQYKDSTGLTMGSKSANSSWALAAGNTNPQGIADPPPPSFSTLGKSADLQSPSVEPVPMPMFGGQPSTVASSTLQQVQSKVRSTDDFMSFLGHASEQPKAIVGHRKMPVMTDKSIDLGELIDDKIKDNDLEKLIGLVANDLWSSKATDMALKVVTTT